MNRKELETALIRRRIEESRSFTSYKRAARRAHALAETGISEYEPSRIRIRQKRISEQSRYRSVRAERRHLERQLELLPFEVNHAGLRFLELEEGLRLYPYNDSAGHATIGIGHLIHRGVVTTQDRLRYDDFTREEAYALFDRDLDKFEATVRSVVKRSKVKVTQSMFNSLVSLCFNIGQSAFRTSTVAKQLVAGQKQAAAQAFMLWVHPSELRGRRERERDLFLS